MAFIIRVKRRVRRWHRSGGRESLPESVAGAFEFSNERMNNPFLDDADSNNI